MQAFAERDPRVRALAGEGRGIARALNLAAAAARAPLLARMDADDIALPGRLRAQVAALARTAPRRARHAGRALPRRAVDEGMRRYVQWQNGLLSPEEHRLALFIESPLCHPSVMMRARRARAGRRLPRRTIPGGLRPLAALRRRRLRSGEGAGGAPALAPPARARDLARPALRARRFLALKAPHLAAACCRRAAGRSTCGARARTGKRLARALEAHGVRAERFIDVDPRKIGSVARGAPIVALAELAPPGERLVVVALGARGARDLARAELARRGYREGEDYLCAS